MRNHTFVALAALSALTLSAVPAHAGCGCDKPPPPIASIRPAFGSPGDFVSLFNPAIVPGLPYTVTFGSGLTAITVPGVATVRRDFADGLMKPQVTVPVPVLPLGPTVVTLKGGLTQLMSLPNTAFTALPPAMALTEESGSTVFYCYHAGIGADGTTYIPLNIAAVSKRLIFKGFGQGYPIVFSAADIAIYNTQGVLMQLLTPENASIYAVRDDKGTDNSFSLVYDRHEFETYKAEHLHEGERLLDPLDPSWHLDGTRHIDHDNLVIANRGKLRSGNYPVPGPSKSFNLDITTALDDGTPGRTSRNVDFCTSR
jgi:hypothetical protein